MAAFTASSTPDKRELLDAASTATKNDFDAKTKLNCDLTTNAALSAAVIFMSPKERDELFSKVSEWKDFAAEISERRRVYDRLSNRVRRLTPSGPRLRRKLLRDALWHRLHRAPRKEKRQMDRREDS